MSSIIASATAIPGVIASSSSVRRRSMSRRAACRYSSSRWADGPGPTIPAIVTIVRAIASAMRLLVREFRTVVVGRISIDGVDVIGAALLRRIFDDEGRPLDPEVRDAAVGGGTAPGEVGLREVRPNLGHPRLTEPVVHDAGPLSREVQKHGLLRCRQRRGANAFRLDRPAVLP